MLSLLFGMIAARPGIIFCIAHIKSSHCPASAAGNYFDTIAQRQLMKSIALRVNDAAMLALIEAWLEIAIEASDGNGKKPRSSNHC